MPDFAGGGALASGIGSLAGGLGGLFGGGPDTSAIKDASQNQLMADMAALQLQERMYNETVQRMKPWTSAGQQTIPYLSGILNIPGYDRIDPTLALRATPGYDWMLGQGVNARDKSAAARGTLYSGAQQRGLTAFGQGLADQTYKDYLTNLFNVSNTGQSAAGLVSNAGANYANAAGRSFENYGNDVMQGGLGTYFADQAAQNNLMKSLGMIGGGLGVGGNALYRAFSAPSYNWGSTPTGNTPWGQSSYTSPGYYPGGTGYQDYLYTPNYSVGQLTEQYWNPY